LKKKSQFQPEGQLIYIYRSTHRDIAKRETPKLGFGDVENGSGIKETAARIAMKQKRFTHGHAWGARPSNEHYRENSRRLRTGEETAFGAQEVGDGRENAAS
jgi:hypothetical protein